MEVEKKVLDCTSQKHLNSGLEYVKVEQVNFDPPRSKNDFVAYSITGEI